MKLEFNENGSYEFYDECLFIATLYKSFFKKPTRKARQITKYYLIHTIVWLLFLLGCLYFNWIFEDAFFLYIAGIYVIIIAVFFVMFFKTKKQIRSFMDNHSPTVFEITDSYVSFQDRTKSIQIQMKDIKHIVINRYSISFFPDDPTPIIISLSTQYSQEIKQFLFENNFNELLVDNSHLY